MPSNMHDGDQQHELTLRRLYPAGEPVTVEQIVDDLSLPDAGVQRPYVMLNMISTADGRASLGGRSGALGDEADKLLFHGLRTAVDAVMAGAGTIHAERYRRVVRDEHRRYLRRERGLAEEPLMCVVSGHPQSLSDIPIVNEPGSRVVVITPGEEVVSDSNMKIEYVRSSRHGSLDLRAALSELHERLGVRTLLCEGGPHLNGQLLAEGLVDELFLSLSPMLAGEDPAEQALRIVMGTNLDPPIALELVGVLEHESHLFLRYRVASTQPPASASS
jgi:riboflavin biosynthesis pyrimidine reductase